MADRNPTYYDGDLRRELLDAALVEIAATGPSDLSLRALARTVGVSHAAPTHHFASKAGLLTVLAVEGLDRLAGAMTAASVAVGGKDAIERLVAIGVAYVEFSHTEPGYFEIIFRRDLIDVADAAYLAAGQKAIDVLINTVRDCTESGWGAGEDVVVLTLTAWASVHGIAALSAHGSLDGLMPDRDAGSLALDVTRALAGAFRQKGTWPDESASGHVLFGADRSSR